MQILFKENKRSETKEGGELRLKPHFEMLGGRSPSNVVLTQKVMVELRR